MDQKIFFLFRDRAAFPPSGCIVYYLCKNEHHVFGSRSIWNIYSMTVSLAYCCICGYLFLIHCFCPFSCLLTSVVMKTDIKFLNIEEGMEKKMVKGNISREQGNKGRKTEAKSPWMETKCSLCRINERECQNRCLQSQRKKMDMRIHKAYLS